jgi:hypothetical protein
MEHGDAGDGFQLHGKDSASYLGLSGAAHHVLGDVDAAYLNYFGGDELAALQTYLADLDALKRLFVDHRHGCWCGPGHICENEQDAMDSVCHLHDDAYTALGVTSGGPNSGGHIDMWSRAGLQATVEADEALVAGVSGLGGLDAEAEAYRAGVELIFGARARIGHLLRRLPF